MAWIEIKCPHCRREFKLLTFTDPAERNKQIPSQELLDSPVSVLKLSTRAANALAQNHHFSFESGQMKETPAPIKTIGDLLLLSEAELLRCPNFGRISLQQIKDQLAGYGLSLGMF